MTKTAIRRELHNIRYELEWLAWCEKAHNPEWRFRSQPYSKRRARLVKTYWALKQGNRLLHNYYNILHFYYQKDFIRKMSK